MGLNKICICYTRVCMQLKLPFLRILVEMVWSQQANDLAGLVAKTIKCHPWVPVR